MNESARVGRTVAGRFGWAAVWACAASPALAQWDAPLDLDVRQERMPRLEITSPERPRMDAFDAPAAGPRIDLAVMPPRGSVGVSMGLAGLGTVPNASFAPQPTMDLGLQWRHTLDSNQRVDVTAWRRVSPGAEPVALVQSRPTTYGARVELNLSKQRTKGLVADRGFVGFQLEGGGRISIRRKDGRPMIYYRNTF
jgi:hypothetical protein